MVYPPQNKNLKWTKVCQSFDSVVVEHGISDVVNVVVDGVIKTEKMVYPPWKEKLQWTKLGLSKFLPSLLLMLLLMLFVDDVVDVDGVV